MMNKIKAVVENVNSLNFKGLKLVFNCAYHSVYEYEDKQFYILKMPMCLDVDHYETIRNNDEAMEYINHINGLSPNDIPCLGTIYETEGLRIWDYKEVSNYGYSKSLYRKATQTLKEKFDGYCYFGDGCHHLLIDNAYITINNNGNVTLYDSGSEEYEAFVTFYGCDY